MSNLSFRVTGMTCGHCVQAVEAEVGRVPGVAAVSADLSTKLVHVTGEHVDEDAVRTAITDAGYDPE